MADDLDNIEALDDLSNAIKLARQQVEGVDSAGVSGRRGVSINDLPDEDENGEPDPKAGLKNLLQAWEALVEALFAEKAFLEYAPSLEKCVHKLSDMDQSEMKKLRDLVNLMQQAAENHRRHPESAELRYVTLLEVVLSYSSGWKPSSTLNETWEQLELQVEENCEAVEFRRVAYKVLVQLPWVPATAGLYAACSYEESESIGEDIPPHVSCKFDQIYNKPLLRSDKVYQVLEDIDEDEPFTIAIKYTSADGPSSETNGEGLGKTTLAALLASHPTISQNHMLFWVDFNKDKLKDGLLTYKKYVECSQDLCKQLGVSPNWPEHVLRLEDESTRTKREQEHMVQVKEGLMKLFEEAEGNVLVVMDGINNEMEFEWFQLVASQSSIVICSSAYVPKANHTVDLGEFGVDEAIELFANESSNDASQRFLHTIEARTIMEQCLCHPLVVRTAAHWFKLKQVTAGQSKALEELNLELNALRHHGTSKPDPFKVLEGLMNQLLAPSNCNGGPTSVIVKLCLASVGVVLGTEHVPLDGVLALWSQLIGTNKQAAAEIGGDDPKDLSKRVWYVAEAFIHLGLFSFSEKDGVIHVTLHHELYVKYAVSLVPELQDPGASVDETTARWHNCFVGGYNARLKTIKDSEGEFKDTCRPYALRKIITHMINSRNIPKVLELLRDERFCRERLAAFGWVKGAQMHMDDCLLLRRRALESNSATDEETRKVVVSCLKRMAMILSEEPDITDETRVERAMALHMVGFTEADHRGISEAMTSYKNALQLMPSPGHPFNAVVMYSQAVLHLLRNDHDKGAKRLKSCLKLLKDNADDPKCVLSVLHSEVTQLRGDALAATCDYVGAEACYEEALAQNEVASKIDTGAALYRRSRLHHTMGELDQALSALTECIKWKLDITETTSQNLADAYSFAGDLYIEMGEDERAKRQFECSLEILDDLGDDAEDMDRHLINGKIAFLGADEAGAKSSFVEVRTIVKKSPRLLTDLSAYDCRVMGKICKELGDGDVAKEIFEEGIDLTMDRPESLERACILFELGHCLFDREESKESIVCFEEALKIRKSKLGDCELVLDTQIALGNTYKGLLMNQEWLQASKEVMYLTEKLYKGNEGKAATAIFGVAEAYEVLREYDQAVAMFDECKELLKRSLAKDHPDVGNVLQRLGKLHSNNDDLHKASDCYTGALEIYQANFEPEDPKIGESLYNIGLIARRQEDFEKAREFLQDALNIYKHQEMAHETCLTLIELGNVYRFLKDPDTAVMCFERCLTFIDHSEDNLEFDGVLYLSFGHARLAKGQNTDAQDCYDTALKSRTESLGKDHPSTAKASRSLGIVKYLLQGYAEARIYLEDFVRVMESQRTMDDVDYVMALQLLGETNFAESRLDDAKRYWQRSQAALEKHPAVGEKIPQINEMITHRLEKAQTSATRESKSLFSRFTELARFEDEVSSEVPVEERIRELLRNYVFVDD